MLTPFLDGETDDRVSSDVRAHLATCVSCAADAEAGRVARDVLRARAAALRESAPPGLRTRIAARLADEASPSAPGFWGRRAMAVAAFAVLLLVVSGAFEFVPMRWGVLYAAQLAVDHVRCLYLSPGTVEAQAGTNIDEAVREAYGWRVRVPPSNAEQGITLVGVRRCPFGLGPHAHVLYRVGERPVSLYITPDGERGEHDADLLGHVERVWSAHDRTYAVVARGLPAAELDRLEAYFRAAAE